MDAHFVKGLLERDGIEAVVVGENLVNAVGTLPLSSQSLPNVSVREEDEARAAAIVEAYRKTDRANADAATEDAPRATWKCANCGEAVEEQFTECWHCGHSKEPAPADANPADGPH